jgi:hypothetical protein
MMRADATRYPKSMGIVINLTTGAVHIPSVNGLSIEIIRDATDELTIIFEFIDETAVTTNMVRLNGWNPSGERLFADAPMGHWETVTFIAGLRQTGIVAPDDDCLPLGKTRPPGVA